MARTAIAVFLLASFIVPVSTGAPPVRDDPADPFYLDGYLTWDGTNFGISWDPDAPTQDPGGAASPPDETGAQHYLYNTVYPSGQWLAGEAPGHDVTDTFTSAPLPFDLRVNNSRLLKLDLFLWNEGQKCPKKVPQFDVRLAIGETFVTGGAAGFSDQMAVLTPKPYVPAGYCLVRIRMQSELELLPAGSVLTLELHHWYQWGPFQYGLKGNHRSVLRIPYFPVEEVIFRDPAYARTLERTTGDERDASAATNLMGVVGSLLALLALSRPGRHAGTRAVLLLLLMSGLAGCAKSPDGGPGPTAPVGGTLSTRVFDDPTAPEINGTGTIAGIVLDEFGFPVNRIRVSLLDAPVFADTNPWGRFRLTDVPTGRHSLRANEVVADHRTARYKFFEGEVVALEKALTHVEIQLEPLVKRPADYTRHLHDYWGEKTERTMFADEIAFTKAPLNAGGCYPPLYPLGPVSGCLANTPAPCHAQLAPLGGCVYGPDQAEPTINLPTTVDGGPNLVPPGTRAIEITLDWDQSSSLQRLGAYFHAWNDASAVNVTYLYPRARGTTVHVPVDWEMADKGHQPGTRWSFGVYVPADQHYLLREKVGASGAYPTISTTIKAIKGDVPYEPPHPDFWNGTSSYHLYTGPLGVVSGNSGVPVHPWERAWTPTRLVLLETTWIEVLMKLSQPADPPIEWTLWHKGSDYPRNGDCPLRASPEYTSDGKGNLSDDGLATRWAFPIGPKQPDFPYDRTSQWCFVSSLAAPEPWRHANNQNKVRFSLTVIAHKDAFPAGGGA